MKNIHSSSQIAEQLDSYFDIFNHKAKGLDQLNNLEDRKKLLTVQNQINHYLEEVTSETGEWQNGYLSTKVAGKLASQISEEMKLFSLRMVEKKK